MGTVVGMYGRSLKFKVSRKKVITFSDMERTQEGRWKDHEVYGSTPQSEFIGPDATEATLKIKLMAQLGVSPRKMIKQLELYARQGTVDTLVINGKKYGYGSAKWSVTSVTDTWDRFVGGKLVEAGATVKFKEYAESSKKVSKKKSKKKKSKKKKKSTKKKSATAIKKAAQAVIKGKYGKGAARKRALKKAGFDPKAVQKQVNALLGAREKKSS